MDAPAGSNRTLSATRVLVLALACLAATLIFFEGPAHAVVTTVNGTVVGTQPREEASYWEGDFKWNGLGKLEGEENAAVQSFGNDPGAPSQPGPVMHSVATYAIYWDPQDYYHGDWQNLIDRFMKNVGAVGGQLGNVFAVDEQYSDKTNKPASSHSTFRGAYTDTNPYPTSEGCVDPHVWARGVPLLEGGAHVCLTDAQLRSQLETFITQHSLQKGMGTIFYLLTPPGVTVCLDSGGSAGHCSDFTGTVSSIANYEEEKATFLERVKQYNELLAAYEKTKKEDEANGETDEAEPPVKPTSPHIPANYPDYQRSFCSYHADINPSNAAQGDANTILYSAVPWTAGGEGDYKFAKEDMVQGVACQDGGFKPGSTPLGELEEKEREKPQSAKEVEEFEKKTKAEQREEEEAQELGLAKPHEQEPNQLGPGRGPDGYWDEGLADLIINQVAVEQQNTVTDPLLNAWHDATGNEVTDECRNSFFAAPEGDAGANPFTRAGTLANQVLGEGKYYLNDAYNLASRQLPYPGVQCMNDVALEPQFTSPNPVNSGELVSFDGMESDVTLDAATGFSAVGAPQAEYATYTWTFGDGSPAVTGYAPGAPSQNSPWNSPCSQPWLTPCAASTFHSYQYGGTYEVTLTVTDVGGNSATVTRPVTVLGPLPPHPSPAPPGTIPGGASGAGGSPAAPAATVGLAAPPAVTASAVSKSLKKALSLGLALHYSVNEQVAGRVEVLLDSATAKRLGIKGPAGNLPSGYPRSIVIGRAVLVTTRAGQGIVRVRFSKTVAKRLAKVHQVKVTLRFSVRNASRNSPRTTTTLSTVVLSH